MRAKTVSPELEEDLTDLEAERIELEAHLNEINKRNERFMEDLAKLHDRDIQAFLERMREDPIGNGKFDPPGTRIRRSEQPGGMNHPAKNREQEHLQKHKEISK